MVWAETDAEGRPQRAGRDSQSRPHPTTAPHLDLRQFVAGVINDHPLPEQQLNLWLPSDRRGPLPPPELGIRLEADETPPSLIRWTIPAAGLSAEQALSLFVGLHQRDLPPTIRLGSDARYWLTAFSFLLELLARQLARPTLVERQMKKTAHYEARWLPILDGEEEARRVARLAEAMPAVCRAAADDPAHPIAAGALLEDFLAQLIDTAMREWNRWFPQYQSPVSDPGQAWLRALFALDPTVSATAAQMQHFAASFRAWERLLTVAGDRHYRVALRLEAPQQQTTDEPAEAAESASAADANWQLHYLLQARDDLGLLVPAEEVWNAEGVVLQSLGRHFDRPRERLLTGLGYAARFSPPIERSLSQRAPTGTTLTADEAYVFLRQCAPQLQRAGFGLLVPPWWNKPGTRLGVRLKLTSSTRPSGESHVSSSHMSLQNLVNYQWQLSLGDTELSREEFDALVSLKTPLVSIRGQWVQLDPDQIEAAIRFWKRQDDEGTLSLPEAMRLGLGGEAQHEGLAVDDVEMDDWLQSRLNRLRGDEKLELLPPPAGISATLRPYQQLGYSWLHFAGRWGLGVILADDMGLGKTIQALAMIQRLKEETGALPAPVLLVCPTSVVMNWENEKRKFAPELRTLVHHGGDRLRDEALIEATRSSDMLLTSYALMRRDGATLRQVNWLGIILDEAQNIKNAGTKQAQVIRGLPADFRVALTGTPVENRLSELWSIMQFLNPGYLGSRKQFRERFILPVEKYHDEEAARRLRTMTRPFLLRRLKTDTSVIQDLPDKQEVKVYCTLSEEQATLYEAVVRDAIGNIEQQEDDGFARKGLVLSMLMQLKQVCNHPAQYLHEHETYRPGEDRGRSGKLERLNALLEEVLAEGDRLLIFSQFTEMAGMLQRNIEEQFGVSTLYLHGGVPAAKRAAMVARFQEPGGPQVFLLSLKAGGTGLNLTAANHVFHFDRWWNPAVEDQATDRAFRIGQTKNVLVHKFVCLGTLEERIDAMMDEKRALADSIIGSGENWLTELSTASLRELVSLRRDD